MKHDLELDPFATTEVQKVAIIPIKLRRLATKVEKERLKHE